MTGLRTRVVVADDDQAVRDALSDLVASQPDLDLVGAAVDHPDAIRLAVHNRPDALLLDVRMPRGTATGTVRAIRDRAPDVGVLVLSGYEDPASAVDLVAAGASGYLVKGVADQEVLEGIARTARGQLTMSAPLARQCVELLRRHPHAIAGSGGEVGRTTGEATGAAGGPAEGARGGAEAAVAADGADDAGGGTAGEEGWYRLLFEHAPEATVVVDQDGRILQVNAATEGLFGYPREQLRGRPVDVLLPDHPVAIYRRDSDEVTARPSGLELVGRRRDGSELPIELSVGRVVTDAGPRVILTVRDMTEIAGARDVLENSLQVLREAGQQERGLVEDLVRAQERERARIAAGIHDDSLQVLTAASLRVQQLRRRLSDPEDLKVLSKVEETLKLAGDRLRRMIFDFRPPALEDEGLVAALQIYLDRLQEDTGVSYRLDSQLDEEPPLETRVVIYRIVQEALMNVRKHARASRVGVRLSAAEGGCLVEVTDDGVGYYPQRAESRSGHLGLILMRDRAEIAGGWCRIESAPGAGTTVEFWVPFEVRPEGSES